jgi:hypothetical protein
VAGSIEQPSRGGKVFVVGIICSVSDDSDHKRDVPHHQCNQTLSGHLDVTSSNFRITT